MQRKSFFLVCFLNFFHSNFIADRIIVNFRQFEFFGKNVMKKVSLLRGLLKAYKIAVLMIVQFIAIPLCHYFNANFSNYMS